MQSPPQVGHRWRWTVIPGVALALALLAAYANSFRVPFVFDDLQGIVSNLTIRQLDQAWRPPAASGVTTSGRPVLNVSLAVNYAWGGTDVRGYHGVNLLIHLLAALTLAGLVRRTLQLPRMRARWGQWANAVAWTSAALWALHPLQTESVTYVIQRAESLAGLFFLLTLYGYVCSLTSARPWVGGTTAVVACLLGGGTKEILAVAPVLVALYDRTFVASSWREVVHQRGRLLLLLGLTWVPLAALVASTGGDRGGTFALHDPAAWWRYGSTQAEAVVRYVQLSFWPHPLVIDRGLPPPPGVARLLVFLLPVSVLLALTVRALFRAQPIGWLGAWFFLILAPTSLLPGTIQAVVDHRMYLPLAALVVLVVAVVVARAGRRGVIALLGLSLAAGLATYRRNHDYRSELALWSDAVAKVPDNPLALSALGAAYWRLDRTAEAEPHLERALALAPEHPAVLGAYANLLLVRGRVTEAIAYYEAALAVQPYHYDLHYNLGRAWLEQDEPAAARRALEKAVLLRPDAADAHYNLANALASLGQLHEAETHYRQALELDPAAIDARNHLGDALLASGRIEEALAEFRRAVAAAPASAESQLNLGRALGAAGDLAGARDAFAAALELRPDFPAAHFHRGQALLALGDLPAARRELQAALRTGVDSPALRLALAEAERASGNAEAAILHLQAAAAAAPEAAEVHFFLGNALAQRDRPAEAVIAYERCLALAPGVADAWNNLGIVLAQLGRMEEARARFEEAVRLDPAHPDAKRNLARTQGR